MKVPQISLQHDGSEVWFGSLTQFARDNGRDVARDIIKQVRDGIEVNGRIEPAFVGGGAAPEFMILIAV